jgi:hypothetical protein
LTDHDLIGAVKDYGMPLIIVVKKKECRKGYQSHKHQENDIDP